MGISLGDIASFATGVVKADEKATAERLVDRRAELAADRQFYIDMKTKKYESELKTFEEENKKYKAIQAVNAKFKGQDKVDPGAYGKAYLQETNPTLLLQYETLYKDNPNLLNIKLATFGGESVSKFKTSTTEEALSSKLKFDVDAITADYKTQLENARGDSKLINAIIGKRDKKIADTIQENEDSKNGVIKAKEIAVETSTEDEPGLKFGEVQSVNTLLTPSDEYTKVFNSVKKDASFKSLNDKDNLINFIGLSKKMNFASDMNFKFNDKDDSIEGMGDSAKAFLDTYKNTYNQVLNSFDAKILYNLDKSSSNINSVLNKREIENRVENILLQRENILTTGDTGIKAGITKNRQVMTTIPLSVVDMNNQSLINGKKVDIDIYNSNDIYQKFLKDKAIEIYGTDEGDQGIRNIIKVQGFIETDKNNSLQLTNELKVLLSQVKEDNAPETNTTSTNNTVAPDKVANEIESSKPKSTLVITEEGISNGNGVMTWELIEKTNQVNTLTSEQKAKYDEWKAKQLSKSDTTINDGADTVFSNMVNQIEDDITGKKKLTSRK